MKDLTEQINDIESELCELQSCIDIIDTINDLISVVLTVSEHRKDYPQQIQAITKYSTIKIKKLREMNENLYKAARR